MRALTATLEAVQVAATTHCVVMVSDVLNPATCVVLALYSGVAPELELEF